jgi:hypothetical protein
LNREKAMKLRGITVAGVFVVVAATLVGLGIHRDGRVSSGFERVAAGMSHQEVVERMGSLRISEACDSGFLAAHHVDGCVAADVYPSSFAPLDPEYWVVYLDKDKRVIDKVDLQSP